MPELPEVQTVVSDLNEKIKGDVITEFWSEWPKAIKGKSLAVFKKEIVGKKILGVRRIGKNIFVDLSDNKTLYIHLKMTGHLLVKKAPQELSSGQAKTDQELSSKHGKNYFADKVNQYIRHRWTLRAKNHQLKTIDFSDVRKFAKIVLDDTKKINNLPEIKKLGVDAVSQEFTFKKFSELLDKKKNTLIGIILMDQNLIAGIGNIYRSEILYLAGILPNRKALDISKQERKKLHQSIGKILQKAIRLRGTSDSDYRDTSGAPGGFQKVLQVYRKAGEKCPKCDTIIVREQLGQRSVFYCPICQK
jgi:formamidopyrimidine-DNA glycosylase